MRETSAPVTAVMTKVQQDHSPPTRCRDQTANENRKRGNGQCGGVSPTGFIRVTPGYRALGRVLRCGAHESHKPDDHELERKRNSRKGNRDPDRLPRRRCSPRCIPIIRRHASVHLPRLAQTAAPARGEEKKPAWSSSSFAQARCDDQGGIPTSGSWGTKKGCGRERTFHAGLGVGVSVLLRQPHGVEGFLFRPVLP